MQVLERATAVAEPHRVNGKLRLVLLASGCDATGVGEVWNIYQWVSRLARFHDVTLLTFSRRDGRATAPQLPGVRVIEWKDLPVVGRWERFNAMAKPGYLSFYAHARKWIKARMRAGERFDIMHQISPVAMRYPCPAIGMGIPVVIGPVGGSIETPAEFESELGSAPWYTKLRAIDKWRLRYDPWLRRSFASADCLLCIAPYVKELLGDLPKNVRLFSETGVAELPAARERKRGDGLRLLFVGRMIRTKGARDAIRALAQVRDIAGLRFDIVGDGYDLPACKEEAEKLGLNGTVRFHGRLARKDVDPFYEQADVFLFPSFREPGGIAVFEAMSHGLAMIVADGGGPGFVVDDACGIRVPITEPADFASNIAAAVRRLASSPGLAEKMGAAAREAVRQKFLWDAKVSYLSELYRDILISSSDVRS